MIEEKQSTLSNEDNWSPFPELIRPIIWKAAKDSQLVYTADVDGESWNIRLGDFPDEPLYSLFRKHLPEFQFNDWPLIWEKPD